MSAKYLGDYFDIHCGGEDHIPVHHTNEIAQSQACYGTKLANFWMHGYFLQLEAEKMSKSSGKFLRIQTLVDRGYDPLAYRYFCLSAHYRAKLSFSWEGLDGANNALERLRNTVYEWGQAGKVDDGYIKKFTEQINDDLNMPRALAVTWDLARSDLDAATKKATMLFFDQILGFRLDQWQPPQETIPAEILTLVQLRQEARREKRWADADALRLQVSMAGYEIEDTPQGARVKAKKVQAIES
jgi:cysteinyl-tRNA synthetase